MIYMMVEIETHSRAWIPASISTIGFVGSGPMSLVTLKAYMFLPSWVVPVKMFVISDVNGFNLFSYCQLDQWCKYEARNDRKVEVIRNERIYP